MLPLQTTNMGAGVVSNHAVCAEVWDIDRLFASFISMKRKSKRKNKKKKQTAPPKLPLQPYQPPAPTFDNVRRRTAKIVGSLLALTGLLSLIPLFPRLSASAMSPLDVGNQLASSRFTVTNDGYFQVTDVMSACFMWRVVEGGVHATASLARVVVPPEARLPPTEGYTVPCTSENMFAASPPFMLPLRQADLAIVVYYRPWPFTLIRRHRLFRFVARIGGNGTVDWDKQPTTEEMERDYDSFVKQHGGTFPPTPPHGFK